MAPVRDIRLFRYKESPLIHVCHSGPKTKKETKLDAEPTRNEHRLRTLIKMSTGADKKQKKKKRTSSKKDICLEEDGFYGTVNKILKKSIEEVKFQTFVFESFLRLTKKCKVEPTGKIMYDSIVEKKRFQYTALLSALVILKSNIFEMYHKFDSDALTVRQAWSIADKVTEGRCAWASKFLTGISTLHEDGNLPTKLYWHMTKELNRLKCEEGALRSACNNSKQIIKEWKSIADRGVALEASLNVETGLAQERMRAKGNQLEAKMRVNALAMDAMVPVIDVLGCQIAVFEKGQQNAAGAARLARAIKEWPNKKKSMNMRVFLKQQGIKLPQ